MANKLKKESSCNNNNNNNEKKEVRGKKHKLEKMKKY